MKGVIALGGFLALVAWQYFGLKQTMEPPVEEALEIPANPEPPARPVYPYSVIPGGALSAAELQGRLETDSVAARHYAGFRVEQAVMVLERQDRLAYVSYRAGGKIYWTNYRVRIKQGERLLTDGLHYARTRCGNRLSDEPAEPTSPEEPVEEALQYLPPPVSNKLLRFPGEMELPPVLPLDRESLTLPNPPAISDIQVSARTSYPTLLASPRLPLYVQSPVSVAPEPCTTLLIGGAMAAFLLHRRRSL